MNVDPTTTERALIRAATKIQADDRSKFNRSGPHVKRTGKTGEPLPIQPGQWKRVNRD